MNIATRTQRMPKHANELRKKKRHELNPEMWFANYQDYLVRFALNRLPDRQTAEDLVQDVFIAAWKGRNSFKGKASEKTWLTTILRNKIIDFYRARGRRPHCISVNGGADTEDDSLSNWLENCVAGKEIDSPEKTVRRSEFMESLQNHLEGLPDKMRKAFWMREIEGHSSEEITRSLSLTTSNLSTLISRAKQHLRQSYGCVAGQI